MQIFTFSRWWILSAEALSYDFQIENFTLYSNQSNPTIQTNCIEIIILFSIFYQFSGHRLEDIPGIRRHKINRKKRNAMASIVHIGKSDRGRKKIYKEHKKYDHSPHEVYIFCLHRFRIQDLTSRVVYLRFSKCT